MAKVKLCIAIPQELKKRIDKRATKDGRTPTSLVGNIITEYIEKKENK